MDNGDLCGDSKELDLGGYDLLNKERRAIMTKPYLNTVDHYHLVRDLVVKQNHSHEKTAELMSTELNLTITRDNISRFCSKNHIYKNRRGY